MVAGEERRRSKPVGPSPGQEEKQPVSPSPGHHRGSQGGEEEEQTSASKSGTGGEETSVSESGASTCQWGRRGGGENQWVRVLGITVAAGEERRRSKPVDPSPGKE